MAKHIFLLLSASIPSARHCDNAYLQRGRVYLNQLALNILCPTCITCLPIFHSTPGVHWSTLQRIFSGKSELSFSSCRRILCFIFPFPRHTLLRYSPVTSTGQANSYWLVTTEKISPPVGFGRWHRNVPRLRMRDKSSVFDSMVNGVPDGLTRRPQRCILGNGILKSIL